MGLDLKHLIGIRVRAARKAKGLTQEQLAERIDRTVESVSNIERGQNLPTLDTLVRLSACLDRPVRDFFEDEAEVARLSPYRAELEAKLGEAMRGLSDRNLEAAIKMIDALPK